MWKPSELEAFSMLLDAPMKALEMRIMLDIVRRIKINGEITRSADWQINRLSQLGMARDEITSAIQQALGYSDEDMRQMYEKIIGAGYARDEKLYTETGTPFIPFAENESLQQLISSVAAQTNETLKNITQSLGFAVRAPDGRLHFTELADYYQKTLDGAIFDIASGAFDYNTVLKRVVREMTNSGLRTVDYASGHSNRVEVAARRAVMTGLGQLTDKVNNDNAEALGTDTFEISWHTGARPSHWWGGMWFTSEQLVSVCHYGEVDGLCGVNCYHDKTPVIPGLSEPSYTKEELAELNAKEKEKITFGDKEYNKYEATQRQRRLETTMRAQRQEIKLLKEGGADEDSIIEARARYRKTSDEYARFSKAMELPQQRERVTVDGLGNIGQGKYTPKPEVNNKSIDNGGKSSIIESGARYGAYNDKNDPNNIKREASAERYYEEIRNRDRNAEIEAISQNTGFSKDDVDAIFSHVFEQEHPFEDGTTHRFVPDYYMQQSFMRIREGKNIQKHDITLLNHELAEYKLMSANPNMVYEDAHAIVEKQYNYAKELLEYLKEKSKKGG
jgi:hypothetical protein